MSLLCVKVLDFKLFSTFFGMQKKIAKHVVNVRKLKNTKYCIQNNVQSCFVEYEYFDENTHKRREICETAQDDTVINETGEDCTKNTSSFLKNDNCTISKKMILREIEMLENMVRKGDTNARNQILMLLPLYSYMSVYKNMHNIIKNIHKQKIKHIDIRHMPDITVFLHQCILPTRYHEDDIVILMRSCIPFFQNPRRVKQDHAWPPENDKTLIILIKCCVPSLLSIYPSICIKDISFRCRSKIMVYLRHLLVGTFEQRNTFYVSNKVLIKMCLIEYIYFFINHINPLPKTKFIQSIDIKNMATNIFNIGQQLRVEINSEYNKNPQILIPELFATVKPKCLVMYERTSRYNKNMIVNNMAMASMSDGMVSLPTQSIKMRKQNTLVVLKNSLHHLSKIPYTNSFQIFDNYCQRSGIETGHINVLWDTMQRIKVYELTLDLFEKQKNSIEQRVESTSALHMQRQSNLLVCISCIEKNIFPKFRHDVRKNEYKCTRCDIEGSVFEVNVMGRLIVVCNIPLVFSTCCNQIVVYSGTNNEFQAPKTPCNCIKWTNNTNTSTFNSLISSMSVSQYVFPVDDIMNIEWVHATTEYMQARMSGNNYPNFHLLSNCCQTPHTCCVCNYTTSNSHKYILLDIHSSIMLSVRVCSKHSIPEYRKKNILSIDDYLGFLNKK